MNLRLVVEATCLLALLIFFFNREINSPHHENEDSVAVLKEKTHEVQTRKEKSLTWEDTNLGDDFQYNDSILTMKDSEARLLLNDGTNLEIGPDSLVVLEPPLEKQSGMRLNLKQGMATLHLKKGAKVETKNKSIVAKEDVTIKLSSDTKNAEDRLFIEDLNIKGEKPKISPIETTFLPKRDAKRKPLRPPKIKMKHQVVEFGASLGKPLKSLFEQLISLLISQAEAQTMTGALHLEWEELPGASSYEIEISQDKEFKNIIMTETTKHNLTAWTLKEPGKYYWHVRGVDEDGNAGGYSDVASVEVLIAVKEISIVPLSQEKVTPAPIFRESAPKEPTPQNQEPSQEVAPAVQVPNSPKNFQFNLSLGVFLGLGTMGSTQNSISLREMSSVTIFMNPELKYHHFGLGPYGEYSFVNQITSPSQVQNQNMSGSGYLLGLNLSYELRNFFADGTYEFFGTYNVSPTTQTGQSESYSNPMGLQFMTGYKFWPRFGVFVTYQYLNFNSTLVGGAGVNIAGGPVNQQTYGLGVKYWIK